MIESRYVPREPADWERYHGNVTTALDEVADRLKATQTKIAGPFTSGKVPYWDGSAFASTGVSADPAGNISTSGDLALSAGDITIAGTVDGLDISDVTSGTGLVTATAANTVTQRTITGDDGITVTNGNGVSGNPTVAQASPYLIVHVVNDSTHWSATSTTYDFDYGNVAASSYGLVGCPYPMRLLHLTYKGNSVGSPTGTFTISLIASREGSSGSTILTTANFTASAGGRHIESKSYNWSDNYAWAAGETVHVKAATGGSGFDGSNYLRRHALTMTFGIAPSDMPLLSS